MRVAATCLLLALMACPRAPEAPAVARLHGEAAFLERLAIVGDATLQVALVDLDEADPERGTVAETTYTVGNPPYPFSLDYDPSALLPERAYGLRLRLRGADGQLMFATLPDDPPRLQTDSAYRIRLVRTTEAAPDPWEEARGRGVAFRAVGNEPGWFVEVDRGEAPAMRLALDYGERRLALERVTVLPGGVGYRGAVDGQTAELRLVYQECRDVMSGEAFPVTATLQLGAQRYQGCGRFLDP